MAWVAQVYPSFQHRYIPATHGPGRKTRSISTIHMPKSDLVHPFSFARSTRPHVIEWVLYNNIPTSVACQTLACPARRTVSRHKPITTCRSLAQLMMFLLIFISRCTLNFLTCWGWWDCILKYSEYQYLLQPRSPRYFSRRSTFWRQSCVEKYIHDKKVM